MSYKNTDYHFDAGKPRWDLLQWGALEDVARVSTFGADKYGDRNWEKHVNSWEWGRLLASTFRHLVAFLRREEYDPESGLPHLAHAVWNLLALMILVKDGLGVDDRSNLPTLTRLRSLNQRAVSAIDEYLFGGVDGKDSLWGGDTYSDEVASRMTAEDEVLGNIEDRMAVCLWDRPPFTEGEQYAAQEDIRYDPQTRF